MAPGGAGPEGTGLTAPTLDELGRWPRELCRRHWPSVLPRLLSMYQCSDSWTEHVRVLKILTEMFLPHINLLELEQAFFSHVLPQTVKVFDEMMYELSSQAKGLSSQNLELRTTLRNILQAMVEVLGALTGCVRHVCSIQEPIVLENIHTLPISVIHVIKKTFVHCKDSESVYSGHLHLVSDLLQALFKEAYSLQKQLMELLDTVSMDPSVAEDDVVLHMVSVIQSMLDICSVISSMDHAFHANTWKFVIKQSLKHQPAIERHLKHKDIITALCDDNLVAFHSCLQIAEEMAQSGIQDNVDQKLFQKMVKLCRFFANSLVRYTKEFMPFISDSCCKLHQFYLQIHSKFPPSLYSPVISKAHQDEIAGVFLVALDPLISQLLSFQPFVEVLLGDKLGLSSDQQLPQCLLLVTIMDKLSSQPEDVQTLWCSGNQFSGETTRSNLFKALFGTFEQCSGELALPVRLQGVVSRGQAEVAVTLYQHVCVHLCTFIASFHPSLFPELDASLLDAVLSYSTITSLLAMDAWCFLARYGTAELCAHHVFIIAHLRDFLQNFPPKEEENLPLWQYISFKAFPLDLRKQIVSEVTQEAIAQCKKWISGKRVLGELEPVNAALSVLLNVCSSAGDTLETEVQSAVLSIGSQLWALLHIKQVSSRPSVQQTFCLLLPLFGFFIHLVDPQLINQVVTLQTSLLQLDPPDYVHLAGLDLAGSLGKLRIPPDIQDEVGRSLACLFATLLNGKSWLLQQHALEAFTRFAEGTSHEEIVPQCLNSEELKNKVVRFLDKVRLTDEPTEARAERVKQERSVVNQHLVHMKTEETRSDFQPSAKRPCQERPLQEQLEAALLTADEALATVQLLLQKIPAPGWLPGTLVKLQARIANLEKNSAGGQ
uniref:FIGNL1 interacting regulator of recombination and mitosis n=1 Tax=Ornithorhynchus anatinus TaxID=9258 RepID=A0A6I8N3B3_ORNAN